MPMLLMPEKGRPATGVCMENNEADDEEDKDELAGLFPAAADAAFDSAAAMRAMSMLGRRTGGCPPWLPVPNEPLCNGALQIESD